MTDGASGGGRRNDVRVDFQARVELSFSSFQGFLNEYATNISRGGMFIAAEDPKPPGTVVRFRIAIEQEGEGIVLVQGSGVVVWIRERRLGPDIPPGMGVQFISLDRQSKQLIDKVVDETVRRGGAPFDLEREVNRGVEDEAPALPKPAPSPKPQSRPSKIQLKVRGQEGEEPGAADESRDGAVRDASEPAAAAEGAASPEDAAATMAMSKADLERMRAAPADGSTGSTEGQEPIPASAASEQPELAAPARAEAARGADDEPVPAQAAPRQPEQLELDVSGSGQLELDQAGPADLGFVVENGDELEAADELTADELTADEMVHSEGPSAPETQPGALEPDDGPSAPELSATEPPAPRPSAPDEPVDRLPPAAPEPASGTGLEHPEEPPLDLPPVEPATQPPSFELPPTGSDAAEDAAPDEVPLSEEPATGYAAEEASTTGWSSRVGLDLDFGSHEREHQEGSTSRLEGSEPSLQFGNQPAARRRRLQGARRGARVVLVVLLIVTAGAAAWWYRDQIAAVYEGLVGGRSTSADVADADEVADDGAEAAVESVAGVEESSPEPGQLSVEPVPEAGDEGDVTEPGVYQTPVTGGEGVALADDEAPDAPEPAAVEPSRAIVQPVEPGELSRVESISWHEEGGRTIVRIATDAPVAAADFNHLVLSGPARVLVRLIGVGREYRPYTTEVGAGGVERIRAGLHREFTPTQLYVVVDLASDDVVVQSVEADGAAVRVVLEP